LSIINDVKYLRAFQILKIKVTNKNNITAQATFLFNYIYILIPTNIYNL